MVDLISKLARLTENAHLGELVSDRKSALMPHRGARPRAVTFGRGSEDLPHAARDAHMDAGVTDRLWEVSDLVALLEADERGVRKSGVN